jgi:anti-sigma factor RsiW
MNHLGHRLSALIDGELDDGERDRVLVHLARCEPCRAEAVALRTLKRRMNALGEAAADAALTRRLIGLAGVHGPGSPGQPGPCDQSEAVRMRPLASARELKPSWYVAVGAAAAVVVGVGAAAFLAGGGGGQPAPQVTPAVDTYVLQHDLMTGVVPAGATRYGAPPAAPDRSFSPSAP